MANTMIPVSKNRKHCMNCMNIVMILSHRLIYNIRTFIFSKNINGIDPCFNWITVLSQIWQWYGMMLSKISFWQAIICHPPIYCYTYQQELKIKIIPPVSVMIATFCSCTQVLCSWSLPRRIGTNSSATRWTNSCSRSLTSVTSRKSSKAVF